MMRARHVAGVVFAASVTTVALQTPAMAAVTSQASGDGRYVTSAGYQAHVTVNASNTSGSSTGTVHVTVTPKQTDWQGAVDCYFQQGNIGSMSGVVTSGTSMGANVVGTHFQITVQDNGSPDTSPADDVVVDRHPAAFDCTQPEDPIHPVASGDFVLSGPDTGP